MTIQSFCSMLGNLCGVIAWSIAAGRVPGIHICIHIHTYMHIYMYIHIYIHIMLWHDSLPPVFLYTGFSTPSPTSEVLSPLARQVLLGALSYASGWMLYGSA